MVYFVYYLGYNLGSKKAFRDWSCQLCLSSLAASVFVLIPVVDIRSFRARGGSGERTGVNRHYCDEQLVQV